MLRGRYVATVEIDIAYDEKKEVGAMPLDRLRDFLMNEFTPALTAVIRDECDDATAVNVTQLYADAHEVLDPEYELHYYDNPERGKEARNANDSGDH